MVRTEQRISPSGEILLQGLRRMEWKRGSYPQDTGGGKGEDNTPPPPHLILERVGVFLHLLECISQTLR
jgi:hypothetical protein